MTKNTATNYDAGHRWKSHADFNLICLPYNCKLYLFKHVPKLLVSRVCCWPMAVLSVLPGVPEIACCWCVHRSFVSCCWLFVQPHAHMAKKKHNPTSFETTLNDCLTFFLSAKITGNSFQDVSQSGIKCVLLTNYFLFTSQISVL